MPPVSSQPAGGPSPRGGAGLRPRVGPNRRARRLGWGLALAAAVLVAAGAWGLADGRSCLELRVEPTGRILHSFGLERGQPFTLWFLHSYDRAFFAEHYRLTAQGRILLTHMTFKSNLNGEGFEYSDFHLRPDGVGELRNINEPRETVRFMMGSPDMANHTLILAGHRLPLLQWSRPGDLVDLVPARVPCWLAWWRQLTGAWTEA